MSARKFDGKSGTPMLGNGQAALMMAEFYGVSVRIVETAGGPERFLRCKSDEARRLLLGVSHKQEVA